ncbi:MAG: hypothetical protein DCC55_37210 [Chloroflexi bacterium]|nr:MAG: hypothetical protein DCC55_37210 [Chloroflexota bacterium]
MECVTLAANQLAGQVSAPASATHSTVFCGATKPVGEVAILDFTLKLLVFDPVQEAIVQWID